MSAGDLSSDNGSARIPSEELCPDLGLPLLRNDDDDGAESGEDRCCCGCCKPPTNEFMLGMILGGLLQFAACGIIFATCYNVVFAPAVYGVVFGVIIFAQVIMERMAIEFHTRHYMVGVLLGFFAVIPLTIGFDFRCF